MKLTVVVCDCGNPKPHRKLRTEDERETRGFFSIAEGRGIYDGLLASEQVTQTGKERPATEQALAACGLPETYVDPPASALEVLLQTLATELLAELAGKLPPLSKDTLKVLAAELKMYPPEEHRDLLRVGIQAGILTAEDSEKIFALAAATE